MDFDDSPEEAEFRAEVRAWLKQHAEPRRSGQPAQLDPQARLERARRFLAAKGAKGYSAITWPQELGGLGGTEIQNLIFLQEQAQFDIDTLHGSDFFAVGLELCGGTIMRCGTEEQRRRFIGPLLRGEEIWCQLFSEPACGFGLAESMAKLIITQQGQRSAIAALDMLGTLGSLSATMLAEQWSPIEHAWYWSPAFRIAGGTDEILRTILAERVLGLPAEARVDREVPFNQLSA